MLKKMELLFFLGQDTPINVISEPTHSKLMPPFMNVHIKAGGVDVKDLEAFLLLDNDIYNDLVYLSIPVDYMETYQASSNIKWLMWRLHNDMCHALICDNDMYDKLNHGLMRWLQSSYVAKQLLQLHSSFAKVACDVPVDGSDCICTFDDTQIVADGKLYVHAKSHPLLRKTFAGCLLQNHTQTPSYLQCDFVGYRGRPSNAVVEAPYVYCWPSFTLNCKRPLSSIITSLNQLKHLETIVLCKDLARPQLELVETLQNLCVDFKMVQQDQKVYVQQHRPTLYLHESIVIHNFSMFLSLLRKCPAFNTFSSMLLHAPPASSTHTFDFNMINDSFVYLKDYTLDVSSLKAVLHTSDDGNVVAPLVYPMSTSQPISGSMDPYLTDYYIDTLGDKDFAEQMTEYASAIKSFHVVANVYKDAWSLIKLKQYFQNVVYNVTQPFSTGNNFVLAAQPVKHPFVFHSKVYNEAIKLISKLQAQNYSVVGVHYRRVKLGASVTYPCSDEYYKKAIQEAVKSFPRVCFLLGGGSNPVQEKVGDDHLVVSNHEDEAVAMCAFTLCDGFIMSTSSFAWWSAVLNTKGKVWCPKRWFSHSSWNQDLERKMKQEDWIVVNEDE